MEESLKLKFQNLVDEVLVPKVEAADVEEIVEEATEAEEIADEVVKVVSRRKAIVLAVTINQNLKEKAAEEIRVQIIVEQAVEGVEEDKMPASLMKFE